MARAGIRRAVGFIAAAHRSYSSCTQYRENVRDARAELARAGLPDVEVTYVPDWYHHPLFIEANADRVAAVLGPSDPRAQLVFTAHSIPESMSARYPYRAQFEETARLVAERLGRGEYRTAYQSRSGRPEDPWLGPDICDYLREARTQGLEAAVLSPIGFLCDHVEVLYDLDIEAAGVCKSIGLPDGPRAGGQCSSAVSRHDGGRRAPRLPPLRTRAPARTSARRMSDDPERLGAGTRARDLR